MTGDDNMTAEPDVKSAGADIQVSTVSTIVLGFAADIRETGRPIAAFPVHERLIGQRPKEKQSGEKETISLFGLVTKKVGQRCFCDFAREVRDVARPITRKKERPPHGGLSDILSRTGALISIAAEIGPAGWII
jgi:hypothetical protein